MLVHVLTNRNDITAVVHLDLEDYVASVVHGEMPFHWPEEALKAQAVIARTYAVAATLKHRHRPWAQLCASSHCQVWSNGRRSPQAEDATQQTEGMILIYKRWPLDACVYHASCGGFTSDNEKVWVKGSPRAYLRRTQCYNSEHPPRLGHGVGLCQEGARFLATSGALYPEILHYYYQKTSLGFLDVVLKRIKRKK